MTGGVPSLRADIETSEGYEGTLSASFLKVFCLLSVLIQRPSVGTVPLAGS